jgi:hypothetical protein
VGGSHWLPDDGPKRGPRSIGLEYTTITRGGLRARRNPHCGVKAHGHTDVQGHVLIEFTRHHIAPLWRHCIASLWRHWRRDRGLCRGPRTRRAETMTRSGTTVTRLLCGPLPYKKCTEATAREKSVRKYRFSFLFKNVPSVPDFSRVRYSGSGYSLFLQYMHTTSFYLLNIKVRMPAK